MLTREAAVDLVREAVLEARSSMELVMEAEAGPGTTEMEWDLAEAGVATRSLTEEEILDRIMLPVVNEGFAVLDEKMAARPSDIDVSFVYGSGFPRHVGGPMYWADGYGLDNVLEKIKWYQSQHGGKHWEPSPLLERMVADKATLAELN